MRVYTKRKPGRRHGRRMPKIACELTWQADFGWGEVEDHKCTWPATFVLKYEIAGYRTERERALACEKHAMRCKEKYGDRAYRFRARVANRG